MSLDGVVGDARKRAEGPAVAGTEPMYQPICRCALHQAFRQFAEQAIERAETLAGETS